jgi:V8-like Glu-specific endopeptidase
MNTFRLGRLLAIPTFCLLVLMSVLPTSILARSARPIKLLPSVVSRDVSQDETDRALAYWTPQRMKGAKSLDIILPETPVGHTKLKTTLHHGTPASKAPFIPKSAKSASSLPLENGNATPLPPNQYSSFPYTTIGKVFFTDSRTGKPDFCSGTAIVSRNKSVVDTAGHCVIGNNKNWHTNWIFCPQYYQGATPRGCWGARNLFTSREYYQGSSEKEDDFGEAVVFPNSLGYLMDVVGGAGWAYNQPATQSFMALGYPVASPFDGKSIQYCVGNGSAERIEDGYGVSIPCNMTQGASGGPWFISLKGTFGYINGHNGYFPDNSTNPTHLATPYYDDGWYDVYNAAQNS